jgi:hypothetical protein
MALSLNDEIRHLELMHKDRCINYRFSKCQKDYKSKHGAQCHIPKCKGPKLEEFQCTNKCGACKKAFATKSGLSQHDRHEHPHLRNAHRVAKATKTPARRKPKGFGAVWSKEEIKLMHKLEIDLQGERLIASRMCKFLPNKTNKQIRDKSREHIQDPV